LLGLAIALTGGFLVYGGLKAIVGIRWTPNKYAGADLSIHKIAHTRIWF